MCEYWDYNCKDCSFKICGVIYAAAAYKLVVLNLDRHVTQQVHCLNKAMFLGVVLRYSGLYSNCCMGICRFNNSYTYYIYDDRLIEGRKEGRKDERMNGRTDRKKENIQTDTATHKLDRQIEIKHQTNVYDYWLRYSTYTSVCGGQAVLCGFTSIVVWLLTGPSQKSL